jgi:hypothetical protein
METHKCPFSAPLITHQFGCTKAQEVVRRGGAEIDCSDSAAWSRCTALFVRLKAAALPEFGVEDDLLSMPHSVLVKIQHGGLLGLQRELTGTATVAEKVDDIDRLVTDVNAHHGDSVPVDTVVADIISFKLRARRH